MSQGHPFLADKRPAYVPIWREALWTSDWAALRMSPVYYGVGAPRGDGSAVIAIPGFLGSDLYLAEMRAWLRRIGYRAYRSAIGQNAECLNVLAERLFETMDRASAESRGPVHLIGHSLGGIIARAVATMRPEQVASVVTLGSPFRGIRSHPYVLRIGELVGSQVRRRRNGDERRDCYTGYCGCPFVEAAHRAFPSEVPQSAVFTKTDGVVSWHFCVNHDKSTNVEVKGTHVGLAWNAAVYRHLASFLAEARERRAEAAAK